MASDATYRTRACGWCGQTGKDRDSEYGLCRVCKGQGSVLVAQPIRKCATCGGAAKDTDPETDNIPCEACDGTGWACARKP